MKLDAVNFGIATGIVFAVAWVLCSLLILAIPGAMMQMGGGMIHADLSEIRWVTHWPGFIIGLVFWSLLSAFFAWAIATVYNRLVG